jgi:hypothetical protein
MIDQIMPLALLFRLIYETSELPNGACAHIAVH